jgi:hypothetical protein
MKRVRFLLQALSLVAAAVTGFITAPSLSASKKPCTLANDLSSLRSSGPFSPCSKLHHGDNRRSKSLQMTSNKSDQTILGVSGILASTIVLYSEFTLKTTGCGLPAGPFGILGAAEGISYLGVLALAGYSIYTKIRTGSGLPAGPLGLLGAAEGLSFLAIGVGVVVLGFQIVDYGYIPNAIPVEGGICS